MNNEIDYRHWIKWVQTRFRSVLNEDFLIDLAFIGNTSEADQWEPAPMMDLDICLFVNEIGLEVGRWLLARKAEIADHLAADGVLFDLRVVRGPHKPAVETLVQPQATAHLAVFTPATYEQTPSSLRWAWRKYRCEIEPDRLTRYGGNPPDRGEIEKMISRKLYRLEVGVVEMTEWVLPALEPVVHRFETDHPVFPEYCLMGAMVVARSHARLLGHPEADSLPNKYFAEWYVRECVPIPALIEIWALKQRARQHGFGGLMPKARELAVEFFLLLRQRL